MKWRLSRAAAVVVGVCALIVPRAHADFQPGSDDHPFGFMTIDGKLDASGGMGLSVLLGHNGQSSALKVMKDALLGGVLRATAIGYVDPALEYQPGDSFVVFSAETISSGQFDNLPWNKVVEGDGVQLPRGARWVLRKKELANPPAVAAVLEVAGDDAAPATRNAAREQPIAAGVRLEVLQTLDAADIRPTAAYQTGDGAFWMIRSFHAGQAAVARFDGEKAVTLPFSVLRDAPRNVVPGGKGLLLATNSAWHLVTPQQLLSNASLEALIAENLAAVRAAWAGARPDADKTRIMLQFDHDGRAWLLNRETGQLKVLADSQWHTASEDLKNAGTPERLTLLAPLADNTRLIVAQLPLRKENAMHATPSLYFAWFERGHVRTSLVAQRVWFDSEMLMYDADGSVWLRQVTDLGIGSARRMNDKGVLGELEEAAPLVRDAKGYLWTKQTEPSVDPDGPLSGVARLALYRDDTAVPVPAIETITHVQEVYCATTGDVYVRTREGLQEVRLTPGAPPFVLGRMFPLPPGTIQMRYAAAQNVFCLQTEKTLSFLRVPR